MRTKVIRKDTVKFGNYEVEYQTVKPIDNTDEQLAQLFQGYAECAMWTQEQDKLDFSDFVAMKDDCIRFFVRLKDLMESMDLSINELDMTQTGHDFWLTRNGHGSGFWDRDHSEELGQALSKLSREFGEYCLGI